MKIIEEGKRPEEEIVRFRCESCNSLLECEKNELNLIAIWDHEELYEYLCPVCKQTRQVWSPAIKRNLKDVKTSGE